MTSEIERANGDLRIVYQALLSLLQKGRRAIFVCESGRELAKRYRITAICAGKTPKMPSKWERIVCDF